MPLVATLEAMAQAATLLVGPKRQVTAIRGIDILNGLRFPSDNVQTARVRAQTRGNEVDCDWTCDLKNRAGKLLLKDRPYLKCVVETGEAVAQLAATLPTPRGTFQAIPYPRTDDVLMYHGDALRTLQDVAIDGDDSWGRLIAPDQNQMAGNRQGNRWLASMSLLDGCLYASGVTLWQKRNGAVSVPSRMTKLSLGRQPRPGERCTVHMRQRGFENNLATYDFTLFGDDNAVLLDVVGHTMIVISEGAPSVTG